MAPRATSESPTPDISPAGHGTAAINSFVGRDADIEFTRHCVAESRLVTISGVGGIGKTRLAREIAARALPDFADGVRIVALAAVHLDDEVAETVVDALRLALPSSESPTDQLVGYLGDKRLLLVVDNCEHLLAGCRRLIAELISRAPGVRVLATSREALGIAGERVVSLRPLATPDPGQRALTVDSVRGFGAIQLLEDRARAVQSSFRIDLDNVDAAVTLTAGLDGLPLAIELAAARLRSLSLPELTDRLDDRFAVLNRGDPNARAHHQTLRAMVEWSWDLCSAKERRLWAALATFSDGADLEAINAVVRPDDDGRDVLDELDGLVAKSVVQADTSNRRARYVMLETIIAFGREMASDFFSDPLELTTRHARHYLALAERGRDRFYTPAQLEWTRRLRGERANLTAAFDHLLVAEPRGALRLAATLRFHWLTGPLREGRRWLDSALEATSEPDADRLIALMASAWVAAAQGEQQYATMRSTQITELATSLTSPVWLRRARVIVAIVVQLRGELEAADREFAELIDDLAGPDDLEYLLLTTAVQMLGCLELGRRERAREIFTELAVLCERCGEQWIQSYALAFYSFGAWLTGDVDEAARAAIISLRVKLEFDDLLGSAMMLSVLAAVALRRGDAERAAVLFGRAAAMNRVIGVAAAAYSPAMNDALTAARDEVHDALGATNYRDAFTRGGLMSRGELEEFIDSDRSARTPVNADRVLTERELEVARMVSQGLSSRQIAEQLVLSPRTIDGHVERIFGKLSVRTRAEVAAWVATRPGR